MPNLCGCVGYCPNFHHHLTSGPCWEIVNQIYTFYSCNYARLNASANSMSFPGTYVMTVIFLMTLSDTAVVLCCPQNAVVVLHPVSPKSSKISGITTGWQLLLTGLLYVSCDCQFAVNSQAPELIINSTSNPESELSETGPDLNHVGFAHNFVTVSLFN